MEEEIQLEELSQSKIEKEPVIETLGDRDFMNRMEKLATRVGQSEIFGEFDLFGNTLSLNFQGEQCHKTQFGGIMFIFVAIVTISLTIIYMFPNGLTVNSKITEYSLLQDGGRGVKLFQNTDCFMRVFLWNKTAKAVITGDAFRWLLPNLTAYQVITTAVGNITRTTATPLDVIVDFEKGYYYLNNSGNNARAMIYSSPRENATIRVEPLTCTLVTRHPVFGGCMSILTGGNANIGADFAKFDPVTNDLVQSRVRVPLNMMTMSTLNLDVVSFTTNNKFLGYMANVFSHNIDYFQPLPAMYANIRFVLSNPNTYTIYSPYRASCIHARRFQFQCPTFDLTYSGTANFAEEQFDDITAPMLFFVSLSQTLFYLVYFLFLRNYANNSFKLQLADQLVYILDPKGRHYNFKQGFDIFLACMWHNHFLIRAIDWLLYRFRDTHSSKILPIRAQKAIEMIEYGHNCMTDKVYFAQLNDIYCQENAQPSKIPFVDDQKQEQEQQDQPEYYFEDEIKEQAFRRMCNQHEHYSVKRKLYLRDLLLETDKRYKLVLMAQQMFNDYCKRVREQGFVKEIQVPVSVKSEDISGQNLKKNIRMMME